MIEKSNTPIKMIVTDLDRTLLQDDKTISDFTIKILKQCQKEGIKLVFATARPKRAVMHLLDNLCIEALIVHNGAVMFVQDSLCHHFGIAPGTTQDIIQNILTDYPLTNIAIEIDDVFYSNFDVSKIWRQTTAIHTDFSNLPNKAAEKIIIPIASSQELERYNNYLPQELYIEISEGILALIMHKQATKFSAIQAIAQQFNIPIEHIIAFGDDYNDLEMIKHCGIGIAMKNALTEVKIVADYICDTNNDDGVAKWLQQHLLSDINTTTS